MIDHVTPELWIGDIKDARERSLDDVDRVVTVCQDSVAENVGCAYEHYNMADGAVTGLVGGRNDYALFAEATQSVIDAIERGETVFVHCHMGRSRSPAVCVAVLGSYYDLGFREGLNFMHEVRYTQMAETLYDHAKTFVEAYEASEKPTN